MTNNNKNNNAHVYPEQKSVYAFVVNCSCLRCLLNRVKINNSEGSLVFRFSTIHFIPIRYMYLTSHSNDRNVLAIFPLKIIKSDYRVEVTVRTF